MVKYATALRLGTADADTILKRFTRDNLQHPTYQALVELGKAIKTTFLCHYLHAEASRREVHEGLNVVENWNSANDFIFYGKSGEIATNQRDDQEIAVLSLHLVQACLVYINTLMLQQVLDEPRWRETMTTEDYRGLTPLIYHHVNPYGDKHGQSILYTSAEIIDCIAPWNGRVTGLVERCARMLTTSCVYEAFS